MRRYFTFRLKGSSFEKEVSLRCHYSHAGERQNGCQAWLACVRASHALGLNGAYFTKLELVSWREGE